MSALDNQIKVVKQNTEEIILKTKQHWFVLVFFILWSSGVLSVLRHIIPEATQSLGVINLTCQRAQSGLINCQRKQSQYFGFKSNSAQEFNSVKGTKLLIKDRTGERSVFILTASGQIVVFGGVGADRDKMTSISQQLQSFINSSQTSITVTHDNRFELSSFFILTLLSIFPLSIIIGLYKLFSTQTFIFSKVNNMNIFICHTHTLIGIRTKKYDLNEIQEIKLLDYDDYYIPTIILSSKQEYKIVSNSFEKGTEIVNMLRDFLGFPRLPYL
ncbi:MAG: hypothetical protein IGS39_19140 [Calothrix sp. C42_A2020_038]|nr:hypothetical protein [Calothrix sp. C42_A2020_038]